MISREKNLRKKTILQSEGGNLNDRWKTLKKETGQSKFTSPQVIVEKTTHYTKQSDMANSVESAIHNKDKKTYRRNAPPPPATP